MNDSHDRKFEAHVERIIAEGKDSVMAPATRPERGGVAKDAASPELYVCTDCGHLGDPVTLTRGNLQTEVLLWLALIAPGVLYSVWRLTTRSQGCALCHGRHVIPAASPIGRKLLAELDQRR